MKMKLMRKITHDPHGNEHKLYPLKPNIGETLVEGEAYSLISFLQLWKWKYKERDSHNRVSFEIVVCIVAS